MTLPKTPLRFARRPIAGIVLLWSFAAILLPLFQAQGSIITGPTPLAVVNGCSCGCAGECASFEACSCSPVSKTTPTLQQPPPASGAGNTLFATPQISGPSFSVVNNGSVSYTINSATNPTLTLVRGTTYTFNISANGHPFYIKSIQEAGTAGQFIEGVAGNGTQIGTLTFTVPADAPNTLFYDCQFHTSMTGLISVIPEPSSGGLLAVGMLLNGRWRRKRSQSNLI